MFLRGISKMKQAKDKQLFLKKYQIIASEKRLINLHAERLFMKMH
jgi:hypothetical protein